MYDINKINSSCFFVGLGAGMERFRGEIWWSLLFVSAFLLGNAEIVATARGRLARLALVRIILDLVADNVLDAFKHERAQILDLILAMARADPHGNLVHFAA